MPARPGQPFQPVLPGTGSVRKVAQPVRAPEPPAWNDRSRYRGPQPGQLVMGVTDLADGRMERDNPFGGPERDAGFMEADAHGYIQEGTGVPRNDARNGDGAAYHYFGTHGGRYAKTMKESLAAEGEDSPSDLGMEQSDVSDHDRQVKDVKAHWNRQPTVQFPTDALVHSTQSIHETEGDATDQRQTMRPARGYRNDSAAPGAGRQYGTLRTAGGSPEMRETYTDVPGTGEGRGRIEAIKRDLEQGRTIRKPIWMMKVNGRHFQLDGHHRMVAAREAGQSHIPVKLWDLDAARSSPPPRAVLQHATRNNPALAAHMDSGGRSAAFNALRELAN